MISHSPAEPVVPKESGGNRECGRALRWILADFDDTLAPGDSHAGLLRYILRRRIWPLLLLPVFVAKSAATQPAAARYLPYLVGHHVGAFPFGLAQAGACLLPHQAGAVSSGSRIAAKRGGALLGDLRQPLRAGASPALSATARPVAPPDHWLADALPFWRPDAALLLPRPAQAVAGDLCPRYRIGLERQPARSATAGVGERGVADQSNAHATAKSPGLLAPSDDQKLATVRQS